MRLSQIRVRSDRGRGGGGWGGPEPLDPPLDHYCNLVLVGKSLVSRDESLVSRDG